MTVEAADIPIISPDIKGRLVRAVKAFRGAATGSDPKDDMFFDVYRSPRAISNGTKAQIFKQFNDLVRPDTLNKGALYSLPWSAKIISKGELLILEECFADRHEGDIDIERTAVPRLSAAYVDRVIEKADELNKQLDLAEQFQIAMELADNHVLGAAIIAHAGSRAIARGQDAKLGLNYTDDQIKHWRDCVGDFKDVLGQDNYGDPPGDTYHFFGTMIFGLTTQINIHKRDIILNAGYKLASMHSEDFTKIIRKALANKKGLLHGPIDRLGFNVGQNLAEEILRHK